MLCKSMKRRLSDKKKRLAQRYSESCQKMVLLYVSLEITMQKYSLQTVSELSFPKSAWSGH